MVQIHLWERSNTKRRKRDIMELATIVFMVLGVLLVAFAAVAVISSIVGVRKMEGSCLQEKLETLNSRP